MEHPTFRYEYPHPHTIGNLSITPADSLYRSTTLIGRLPVTAKHCQPLIDLPGSSVEIPGFGKMPFGNKKDFDRRNNTHTYRREYPSQCRSNTYRQRYRCAHRNYRPSRKRPNADFCKKHSQGRNISLQYDETNINTSYDRNHPTETSDTGRTCSCDKGNLETSIETISTPRADES